MNTLYLYLGLSVAVVGAAVSVFPTEHPQTSPEPEMEVSAWHEVNSPQATATVTAHMGVAAESFAGRDMSADHPQESYVEADAVSPYGATNPAQQVNDTGAIDQAEAVPTARPAADGERVINLSIHGNTVLATSAGKTLFALGGEASAEQSPPADEVADVPVEPDSMLPDASADSAREEPFPCPDSLYRGGNSYAVNILKRAGCPRPANYDGPW